MSAVEILRQARELIADKSRWTQGNYARYEDGDPAPFSSEQAVCFCALGALFRAAGSCSGALRAEAFLQKAGEPYIVAAGLRASVAAINDGEVVVDGLRGHEAILRVYDAAIAKAEATNA